jgi:hypothetical protein
MNAFQIHDANGNAINIKDLDTEAAAFWGKEVEERAYAYPQIRKEGEGSFAYASRKGNWFDIIGRQISRLDEPGWYSEWKEVIRRLIDRMETDFIIDSESSDGSKSYRIEYGTINAEENVTFSNDILIGLYARLSFAKPYIELVQHWEAKGYKPVALKE